MKFEEDITQRINTDFGESASEASKLLTKAVLNKDYLNTNRIIRCIIYLAKGNLIDLVNYIEAATVDPRDVLFWAEYTTIEERGKPRRVRDFNKTFDKCTDDVRE